MPRSRAGTAVSAAVRPATRPAPTAASLRTAGPGRAAGRRRRRYCYTACSPDLDSGRPGRRSLGTESAQSRRAILRRRRRCLDVDGAGTLPEGREAEEPTTRKDIVLAMFEKESQEKGTPTSRKGEADLAVRRMDRRRPSDTMTVLQKAWRRRRRIGVRSLALRGRGQRGRTA